MPLLDHFHPPLATTRHWESFHSVWATEIMRTLNRRILPDGYFAEAQVHIGSRVEIDVATFDESSNLGSRGGAAVAAWAPPAATCTMPAVFPDEIEVQIFGTSTGATLVAAIELVSPGNKDRPDARRAFAAKCAGYLQMGIGLVIVDIVTGRTANLHDELMALAGQPAEYRFSRPQPLYATAYQPIRRAASDEIDVWLEPLNVGQKLPTMPLALRGSIIVPLDLETSYSEVCRDSRLSNEE